MSNVQNLKNSLLPEKYYNSHLNGCFGKPTGNGWFSWKGLCPFHADKQSGSLFINKQTGAFKCFSCGSSGGDIIDFYMKANGLSFKESFKALGGNLNA